ncbi:MAG: alpha/beta hydrolase [Burkholderiaceae bacterium]
MTEPRWQDLPPDQLEAIYNPRVAVADSVAGLARRAALSAQARAHLAGICRVSEDLRYGTNPKECLDLYRPAASPVGPAPLALFVHGGYWRGLDKHDTSLVVPALVDAGAVVANVNYDLCPAVSLDTIVEEIIRAVRFCHDKAADWGADASRLVLIGHSAGAHLCARVMNATSQSALAAADLVSGVAAISGIYEPEVITHLTVNAEAQIDLDTARRNDCLSEKPQGAARFAVWAGGNEPPGWIDQSRRYAALVQAAGFDSEFFVLPQTDHFSVLDESFVPGSEGFARIAALLNATD